jgi:integrase
VRTRQKLLALLGQVLDQAVRAGWLATNPAREVKPPRLAPRADIEVLSVEEVWQLVRAAASEPDAAIYLCAALTGLRRGELLALRWGDVDLAGSVIRVVGSYAAGEVSAPKSGKGRSVPMAPEVAQALARLAENPADDDLVFPGIYGTFLDPDALYKRYRKALKAAGLRPLRFHDLRHTFGSRLAAAGVDLHRIQQWMGHADQATTQIYSRWAPAAPDAALIADAFSRASDAPRTVPEPVSANS